MRKILAILFVFSITGPLPAHGRWSTREDAEIEVEFENVDYRVHDDATYDETVEIQLRVLKEGGKSALSTRSIHYNSNISSLKVLEAKTINPDSEIAVAPGHIEDKPLASSLKGFDQMHQVLVAFPEVRNGSRVYLKYSLKIRETAVPGLFHSAFNYGNSYLENRSRVRIDSDVPLTVRTHDPEGFVKVVEKPGAGRSFVEITLLRPILRRPTEEDNPFLNIRAFPRVDVSSFEKWDLLGSPIAAKYEEILNQSLPDEFSRIATAAASENSLTGRINVVTSELATKVNYLGDWKSIAGRFVPRNLKTVAESKFGDCKDFSASTVAILRKLGVDAHVALVWRGTAYQAPPNDLPSLSAFNHAIVHVRDGDRSLWIDPTNFTSFAQGIYPDIAGRNSLVLDQKSVALGRIPAPSPEDSVVRIASTVGFSGRDLKAYDNALTLVRAAAIPYTGATLRASRQNIDYGIVRGLGDESRITEWRVEPYDLGSRIVRDISFRARFVEKASDMKTSAGPAFELPQGRAIRPFLAKVKDRVSDLYIGQPSTMERETRLEHIKKVGTRPLDCDIKSRWVDASRKVSSSSEAVIIRDRVSVRAQQVPNSEVVSEDFVRLQERLNDCFNEAAIVYQRRPDPTAPKRSLAGE